MIKITVEIPDDGSCNKCLFFNHDSGGYYCVRFDDYMKRLRYFDIPDEFIGDIKPLSQCENKSK